MDLDLITWLLPGILFFSIRFVVFRQAFIPAANDYSKTLLLAVLSLIFGGLSRLLILIWNSIEKVGFLKVLVPIVSESRKVASSLIPMNYGSSLLLACLIALITSSFLVFLRFLEVRYSKVLIQFRNQAILAQQKQSRSVLEGGLAQIQFSIESFRYKIVWDNFFWKSNRRYDLSKGESAVKRINFTINIIRSLSVSPKINTYKKTLSELIGSRKPIYINTKEQKIYIGFILEADVDHDETTQYIKIAPIMSGKKSECGKVIFNTLYKENTPPDEVSDGNFNLTFVVDGKDLLYFGEFNQSTHDRLLSEKRIEVVS